MRRRVAITGLGVVSPVGVGADAFWRALTTGASGLSAVPASLAPAGPRVLGRVQHFTAARYLQNERHARVLNRAFELLVGAGALAAADAALGVTPVPPARLGIAVGIGPIDQYTDDLRAAVRAAATPGSFDIARFAESARSLYPLRRLRLLPNTGSAVLSIEHKARGPSLTLVGGHAAGLQAIAEAAAIIGEGRADAMLCGGADSRLTPLELRVFGHLCPFSRAADPACAPRPFDRDRDGVVAGEGAALLLLEAIDSARTRGVEPYAELLSCAFCGPTEGGCAESMRRALLDCPGRRAEVVFAHGEGGVQSDRLEGAALDLVSPGWITTLQPAIGHTMSACGSFNVAAACRALADGIVPPIRSLQVPDTSLPFAVHQVTGSFETALVNAIEPDQAAMSAVLART